MNTKSSENSSGLVATCYVETDVEENLYFSAPNYGYALVRLSDAEAIIAKQAERIKELEAQFQQTHEWLCDRNQQIHEQSAALKLARDAFVGIANVEAGTVTTSYDMRRIALAAIDALGEAK